MALNSLCAEAAIKHQPTNLLPTTDGQFWS